jgi:two-component system response regulator YesN
LKQILFTFLENFNFNTTESVIVKLIAYLKNNYSEDLKLEILGDMFNCNSAYLGKKFKKYTGVQFNTYLDNIRIDVAKEKLRTTDLKIYQISKLIGFTNTDYFFMKFKKYTGLTPKEYKIQCQDGKRIDEE